MKKYYFYQPAKIVSEKVMQMIHADMIEDGETDMSFEEWIKDYEQISFGGEDFPMIIRDNLQQPQ